MQKSAGQCEVDRIVEAQDRDRFYRRRSQRVHTAKTNRVAGRLSRAASQAVHTDAQGNEVRRGEIGVC